MATIRPPCLTSGRHHALSRSRGATAREPTTSNSRRPCSSSARARTTSTFVTPRASTASCRNVVRRNSGSISDTVNSGRQIAHTRPGRPAPLPTSATEESAGTLCATTAQLSRCRSHSRGTSRGPMRPRVTPASASRAAKAVRISARSPATCLAMAGTGPVSRETGESLTPGARPPDVAAPRPQTRCAARRPPLRHERPCARTGSSDPGEPPRLTF